MTWKKVKILKGNWKGSKPNSITSMNKCNHIRKLKELNNQFPVKENSKQ